jgi:hypothetical protein
MMRIKNIAILVLFGIMAFNCSGGGGDAGPGTPPPPDVIDPPGVASLVFPEQNSECTEGSNFTATESDVVFDWNDSANTTNYELVLKNLETQIVTNHFSSVSSLSITILRGTPYSWYIISKNTGTQTNQSATWKFYNAGDAISSYAPFPAELVAPEMGAVLASSTNVVGLDWIGSDVDDDIIGYDVYFGTDNPPTTLLEETTESGMSVNVSSGTTYYWRIITKDSDDNNSESEVFQFRIG